MHKLIPIFISSVCGFSFTLIIGALPLIAQQITHAETVGASIELGSGATPRAGQASLARFRLSQRGGQTIPPANCLCQITVYNAQNQAIAHQSADEIPTADPQAIGTTLTFPAPSAYTVVLSGQSKDGSFEPFALKFPVTVSP